MFKTSKISVLIPLLLILLLVSCEKAEKFATGTSGNNEEEVQTLMGTKRLNPSGSADNRPIDQKKLEKKLPNLNRYFKITCETTPVKNSSGFYEWEVEVDYNYDGKYGDPVDFQPVQNYFKCHSGCEGFNYEILLSRDGVPAGSGSKVIPSVYPAGRGMAFRAKITGGLNKPAHVRWICEGEGANKIINMNLINNTSAYPVCDPMQPPCDVDLVAVNMWNIPILWPGIENGIVARVANNGTDSAQVRVDFILSEDDILDDNDTVLSCSDCSHTLNGGSALEREFHITAPIGITPGEYTMFMVANSLECEDSDPTNNIKSYHPFPVAVCWADLSADWIKGNPSQAVAGTKISCGIQYTNHGPMTSNIKTLYYVSTDSVLDEDDFYLDTYGDFGPIDATVTIHHDSGVPINIPIDAPPGQYYLILKVISGDGYGCIDHILTNNSVASTTMLTILPSIFPEHITAYIPSGCFNMGDNFEEEGYPDELPVHQVCITGFQMDVYEVTNEKYKACVDAGVCNPPSNYNSATRSSYYGNDTYNNYPVMSIRWIDAATYCNWLGMRLPTEAEYEYAARGGLEDYKYPWGNSIDPSLANYENNVGDTTFVDSYPPNNYGLYNIVGNVDEWINDWYSASYYITVPDGTYDPQGPTSGSAKVTRSGSYANAYHVLRVANRSNFNTSGAWWGVGFRCVK